MSYRIGANNRVNHPLKTEIYKKGLTVSQFADLNDLNRWTLNRIFKGAVPRGDTIYLISKGLEMPYEKVEELCQLNS